MTQRGKSSIHKRREQLRHELAALRKAGPRTKGAHPKKRRRGRLWPLRRRHQHEWRFLRGTFAEDRGMYPYPGHLERCYVCGAWRAVDDAIG